MNEQTQEQQVQEETKQPVELTVQDLNGLRAIVDVATQRGAFKAAELEAVGKVYNKLNTFLEAVAAQNQKEGK